MKGNIMRRHRILSPIKYVSLPWRPLCVNSSINSHQSNQRHLFINEKKNHTKVNKKRVLQKMDGAFDKLPSQKKQQHFGNNKIRKK